MNVRSDLSVTNHWIKRPNLQITFFKKPFFDLLSKEKSSMKVIAFMASKRCWFDSWGNQPLSGYSFRISSIDSIVYFLRMRTSSWMSWPVTWLENNLGSGIKETFRPNELRAIASSFDSFDQTVVVPALHESAHTWKNSSFSKTWYFFRTWSFDMLDRFVFH